MTKQDYPGMNEVWMGPRLHAVLRGLAQATTRHASVEMVENVRRSGYLDALGDICTALDLPPVDALDGRGRLDE